MARAAFLFSCLLVVGACGTQPRSRCERVCIREHECVQRLHRPGLSHDKGECIEQCQQLEREPQLVPELSAHSKCVDEAETCGAVVDCP